MKWFIKKMLTWSILPAFLFVGGMWSYFAYTAWRAAPLHAWHTFVPREMTASALGAASWHAYIVHENEVFKEVYNHVVRTLPESKKNPMNRYYENSDERGIADSDGASIF